MTVFSVFLIVLILYTVLTTRNFKKLYVKLVVLAIACTLNVRMGYFLRIGESQLEYTPMLIYLLGSLSILYVLNSHKNVKRKLISLLLFLVFIFVSAIWNKSFVYQGEVFTGNWDGYIFGARDLRVLDSSLIHTGNYLVISSLMIIVYTMVCILKEEDYVYILNKVISITKISVILGWIELFFVNITKSTIITDIMIMIFGSSGAQQNSLFKRGILYISQGATKEPSFFNTVIFYFLLLVLVKMLMNKQEFGYYRKDIRWLIIGIGLLIVNVSLSSVVYLLILLLFAQVYGLFSGKGNLRGKLNNSTFVFLVILMLSIIFVFINSGYMARSNNYILMRIGRGIQQVVYGNIGNITNNDVSAMSRFTGIFYCLSMMVERPLLGFGFGALNCVSGVVYLLNGIGFAGFILCCYTMIKIVFGRINVDYLKFFSIVVILPNLILNDFETITNLSIPLILLLYYAATEKKKKFVGDRVV